MKTPMQCKPRVVLQSSQLICLFNAMGPTLLKEQVLARMFLNNKPVYLQPFYKSKTLKAYN